MLRNEQDNVLKQGTSMVFARHETFHPRHGWLKKGYDKIKEDAFLFNNENAHNVLGVGKNMARSIKYWLFAFKIVSEQRKRHKQTMGIATTEFGENLFGDDGWDPYLEDIASLWLLHWKMLKKPNIVTAWDFAFNVMRKPEFTADDMENMLMDYVQHVFPKACLSLSSIQKDVNCILRMYALRNGARKVSEESVECPFTSLGFFQQVSDTKHYSFHVGRKDELPDDILVASCLEYASEDQRHSGTISISRLMYDAGSPGMVFKLNEETICEAIDKIASRFPSIALTDTAGVAPV